MLNTTLLESEPQADQKQWTYDDYLALPNDGRRYEIIQGVLYVANAPSAAHQYAVTEIAAEMRNFVKANKLGRVLVAPFEVHLAEDTRPVMPDVLFIRAEHWPEEPIQFYEGVPDLVVEVISPSSTKLDRVTKFTAYEQAGVPEYWIVNPKTKAVEVYTLSVGEYALFGEFAGMDELSSVVLDGLTIVVSSLFD